MWIDNLGVYSLAVSAGRYVGTTLKRLTIAYLLRCTLKPSGERVRELRGSKGERADILSTVD
jgi:hypothetical protein